MYFKKKLDCKLILFILTEENHLCVLQQSNYYRQIWSERLVLEVLNLIIVAVFLLACLNPLSGQHGAVRSFGQMNWTNWCVFVWECVLMRSAESRLVSVIFIYREVFEALTLFTFRKVWPQTIWRKPNWCSSTHATRAQTYSRTSSLTSRYVTVFHTSMARYVVFYFERDKAHSFTWALVSVTLWVSVASVVHYYIVISRKV